jgi:hypothetical protein
VCIHPDLIPREEILFLSELDTVQVRGLPMFVDPADVVYPKKPMLRYRVRIIEVLEVEDWHLPDSFSSFGWDLGSEGFGFSRAWPKCTMFLGAGAGVEDGNHPFEGGAHGPANDADAPRHSEGNGGFMVGGVLVPWCSLEKIATINMQLLVRRMVAVKWGPHRL